MAQINYNVLIERMKESSEWPPEKIKKFNRYCISKKLVQQGLIDSAEASKAAEIFQQPTQPPSPDDAPKK